ncbi:MAG: polymerase sigma factor, sigma-70 family [Pedosphaera sp.]|nr:polymerase sigma factor, sigma-70 family [Pedosphaera sp.]
MVVTDDNIDPSAVLALLARARAGDAPAFCHLIEPLQAGLLRQAIALAGDMSVAEDLVSETLVEAWKSLSRYNETCRLSTWLCAILLHRYQKNFRRARSRPISLARLPLFEAQELQSQQENVSSPDPSPAEAATQSELSVQLRQCIEMLPARHREIILLRFFEDASLPDMAAVLGCSVGTVKSRLHHALEKLRKMKMNLPDMKGDK